MKFIYPAIIKPTESGCFQATFPDLACCEATGETLEETVDAANAAMYDWIYLELSEDGTLPPISDEHDLRQHLLEGETIRNICVNVVLTDGWDE
jgi:predicted RNase H-like HicB family nuclease